MIQASLLVVVLLMLALLNTLSVVLVALQLPGTWLMLGATAAVSWWYWDQNVIGGWVLIAMLALAVLGEVLEFIAGAWGARNAGASKRAAAAAIIGGVAGAILGTGLIPVPIIGTIAGAAIGAALGSILGDLWAGRTWELAFRGGRGAAVGKIWGTVAKLGVGIAMWLIALVAIIWP